MPKADTISIFGIATSSSAYNFWLSLAKTADKIGCISMILYELDEMSSQWGSGPPIEFSKESFLKNYHWNNYLAENLEPEDVFAYINWEKGYIDDEVTHIQYWKDLNTGHFETNKKDPSLTDLVCEFAVGGPNAHLIFTYEKEKISPYPCIHNGLRKVEFQYHWWSPVYTIDLTKLQEDANSEEQLMYEAAYECLEQIYEWCYDNFKEI